MFRCLGSCLHIIRNFDIRIDPVTALKKISFCITGSTRLFNKATASGLRNYSRLLKAKAVCLVIGFSNKNLTSREEVV